MQEIAELEAKMDEYENVIRLVKLDASLIHELSSCQTEGIAALKAEVEQLKFGHKPLPCPRTDKSGFSTFPARSDTMEIL